MAHFNYRVATNISPFVRYYRSNKKQPLLINYCRRETKRSSDKW